MTSQRSGRSRRALHYINALVDRKRSARELNGTEETQARDTNIEVIALLEARRKGLWEEREQVERKIERIQRGIENEMEWERQPRYGEVWESSGRGFVGPAKQRIAKLKVRMREMDNRHTRLEEVLERAVQMIGGKECEESPAEAGNELERAIAGARDRMQKERHMLDLLSVELEGEGMIRGASIG